MNENELTSQTFWVNYWESKENLIFSIKRDYELSELIGKVLTDKTISNAIELGGFPGYYAIWLKKYYQIDSTLLDYYVHPEIIKSLLTTNDLKENDIEIIQTDLFKYTSNIKYDLVLSCGLIEHFEDVKDIINRHVLLLNEGGKLLITLPNFTGINGWVQRKFDPYNYNKHNITTMDPVLLTNLCNELSLKSVKCYYYRRFSVWLENKKEKSLVTKAIVKTIWIIGKAFTRLIPIESRFLSPYIVIEAEK
jgi:trans-aconitate methyltransferase